MSDSLKLIFRISSMLCVVWIMLFTPRQEAPKAAPKVSEVQQSKVEMPLPMITPDEGLTLRKLQVSQLQHLVQVQRYQVLLDQEKKSFDADTATLQLEIKKVMDAHKQDETKVDIDIDKMQFIHKKPAQVQ